MEERAIDIQIEKKEKKTVKEWWENPQTKFGKLVRKAAPVVAGIALGALAASVGSNRRGQDSDTTNVDITIFDDAALNDLIESTDE